MDAQTMNIRAASEYEQGVLGSMLLDPSTVYMVKDALTADDFYSELNRIILNEIFELSDKGKPIDLANVYAGLIHTSERERKLLEESGDFSYISNLMQRLPTAANIESYIDGIKRLSAQRKMDHWGDVLKEMAKSNLDDVDSSITKVSEEIANLVSSRGKFPWKTLPQAVSSAMEELMNSDNSGVLSTGYYALDAKLTGLRPGALTIVAARPAMGKTAFGLNIIANACIYNHIPGAFFSLEMTSDELLHRTISNLASINGNAIRRQKLTQDEWNRYLQASERCTNEHLYVDDTPAISISVLRDRVKRMYNQYGIRILVVDYLQLMCSDKKRIQNREQEVADISRGLKAIAKELHIPVVALSQLNRALDSRADKRPVLSDLRESGSIEQDADNVLFIHREDYYHPNDEQTGEAEIIIAKQRSGPTGIVKLKWVGEFTRFENINDNSFD